MYQKQEIGKYGEALAENYLKQKGYKILQRNFRCKQGEIDIISVYQKYIIFVEVKTRCNFAFGRPIDAINFSKKQHMYNAAKYYLYLYKKEKTNIRFDAVEVIIKGKEVEINHIKQIM